MSDSAPATSPTEPLESSRRITPQRLAGRILGPVFMASGILSILLLANLLDDLPRTEDAAVRANLVGVAPHVSGPIVELPIVDNQPVRRGQTLFVVDPRPYEASLAEAEADLSLVDLEIDALRAQVVAATRAVTAAEATVEQRQAEAAYARIYFERVEPLLENRFVTPDQVDKAAADAAALEAAVVTAIADLETAKARLAARIADLGDLDATDIAVIPAIEAVEAEASTDASLPGMDDGARAPTDPPGTVLNARRLAAKAKVDRARLFLDYCTVRSTVDGYVTNLNIAVGEYANEGKQVFTLVDTSIWYVMANFKETYTRYLHVGDPVEVYLMSHPAEVFDGVVQGVGWAIDLQDGATQPLTDLPRTDPTLDWVRLAQRFPVRIIVTPVPGTPFRMGETAAVIAVPNGDRPPTPQFPWVRDFFVWLGLDQ